MELSEVPVLIVGGGPIGLSTSLLLSYHGIRSLLVEQHPGTSMYPKARFINARTMEIFRQIGIERAIPDSVREWSPTCGCTCTQEVSEPHSAGAGAAT